MDFFAQRHSVNKLHGDEVHTVAFVDFMDGGDVWMVERRCRLRLADESLQTIAIRSKVGRKNLQRNFSSEFGVRGQIHLAHTTGADGFHDSITAKELTRFQ